MVNRPKVLITGGSGFIGAALVRFLRTNYEIHFTYHTNSCAIPQASGYPLSLKNEMRMDELFTELRPKILIHTAAMTNVAECEKDWQVTYDVNVRSTANLIDHCRRFECKFILLSTDLVFDGSRGNYEETDHPFPTSRYGKSKKLAEEIVLDAHYLHPVVLRTSLVIGHSPSKNSGVIGWLKSSLESGQPLTLFTDEFRTSIYLGDLLKIVHESMRKDYLGLYHVAGHDRISRYDFGLKFAEAFGYDTSLIRPGSVKDFDGPRRPEDVSLNTRKMRDKFEHQPLDLKNSLVKLKEDFEGKTEEPTRLKRDLLLPPLEM